jgi:M6 family metalloprotease-like protein
MAAVAASAMPAYRGWQKKIQPDGSEIQVRLMGDEYYSYWETKEGTLAIEQPDGLFVKSAEPVPSVAERKARRAAAKARRTTVSPTKRAPQAVGDKPNLSPRGVVILVSFSDSEMEADHTRAVFDNLCNSYTCTTNVHNGNQYGSAAQYFADQSDGNYRPVFDVFGPVQLPHTVKYYGEQGKVNGEKQNDMYLADFVIDAVMAADSAGCDFSQYDSDNDGWVDFVYFIYAGKGQANGGTSSTIWPHNWSLAGALYNGFTHGNSEYYYNDQGYNLPLLDGKYINNYACSAELDGSNQLCGIGTLCHEYGHVMGLPDLYDIEYGDIYEQALTPGEWDIMDSGGYSGNGHCPPNYNPWAKAFFGWVSPVNLGNTGSCDTLHMNGDVGYNVYEVTSSGLKKGTMESGVRYYLENRQQVNWDEYVPAHGLVVWRVDFESDTWKKNSPNASSTDGAPRFTVETAGEYEWTGLKGKSVTKAFEKDEKVIFQYMNGGTDTYPLPEPGPKWTDWAYYDNGTPDNTLGNSGDTFYWGVMFPGYTMANDMLTKVALYESEESNTKSITIDIYSGGYKPQEANKIYTEKVSPARATGWHEITLSSPVIFNRNKNLWVVLSAGTDAYPAVMCAGNSDKNGSWVTFDGANWDNLVYYGYEYTFMVRAYAEPSPVDNTWKNWIYYDDGTPSTSIGTDGASMFYWGVMFPANTISGNTLSKVALYETTQYNTRPITIDIYVDGDTPVVANKVYTETVSPAGANGWHKITLKNPVPVDSTKNLWVVLSEGMDSYPAFASVDTGDPNGRWACEDDITWFDITVYDLDFTFMVRAYVTDPENGEQEGVEEVPADTVRSRKVLQSAKMFIIRGDKIYTVTGQEVQ